MNRIVVLGSLLVVVFGVGCGAKQSTATMEAKSGSAVAGTTTFTENGRMIDLSLQLTGATAGLHAFHIHAVGDCTSADALSAGGHWNPTNAMHGHLDHTTESHLGDIGNVEADANGAINFTFSTDKWTMGDGATTDIVGKAVILHANPDDYLTQPTGNAGGRIGCGVIALK